MPNEQITIGQKYNELTPFEHLGGRLWYCLCSCGKKAVVSKNDLLTGRIKGCGCQRGVANIRHGMTKSPAYSSWLHMRRRCLDPKCVQWKHYGGRGIIVCKEWDSFTQFFADMGERPKYHGINRIDPNGNYEPSNCEWAAKNIGLRRNTPLLRGKSVAQHAKEQGLKYHTAYARYKAGTL